MNNLYIVLNMVNKTDSHVNQWVEYVPSPYKLAPVGLVSVYKVFGIPVSTADSNRWKFIFGLLYYLDEVADDTTEVDPEAFIGNICAFLLSESDEVPRQFIAHADKLAMTKAVITPLSTGSKKMFRKSAIRMARLVSMKKFATGDEYISMLRREASAMADMMMSLCVIERSEDAVYLFVHDIALINIMADCAIDFNNDINTKVIPSQSRTVQLRLFWVAFYTFIKFHLQFCAWKFDYWFLKYKRSPASL